MSAAILDVDGTLVDTNYQHAIAWYRAFVEHEVVLPIWRIHRHIGMGGDQLVPALTSERLDRERGDDIRAAERRCYEQLIDEARPMKEARALIEDLLANGHTVVLASSAKQDELDHYLDLLDAGGLVHGWTTSSDVEATKPEPDLVHAALEKADAQPAEAIMIGDSTWDAEAAKRGGVRMAAVMTGGFSNEELKDAGAIAVYESLGELREGLAELSLG